MSISARTVSVEDIAGWREMYRAEMNCQVVHDNMHFRPGWTESFLLEIDQAVAGYGSVLIGGPWKGTRTLFEFYVLPQFRALSFALFEGSACGKPRQRQAEIQTNYQLLQRDVASPMRMTSNAKGSSSPTKSQPPSKSKTRT